MRKLLAIVCALGAWLAFAVPVEAATPTREPFPQTPVTFHNVCPYFIDIAYPVNNEFITTWFDSSGNMVRQEITGHLVGKFTNESNLKTMTANISGPLTIWYYPNGIPKAVKGEGLSAYITPYPFQFLLGSIRVSQTYDTDGNLLTESHSGHFIDLCAALA